MQNHSVVENYLQNSSCMQVTWPFSLLLFPRSLWGTRGHGKGQSKSSRPRTELGETEGCSSIQRWGDPGKGDGQHRTAARDSLSVGESETARDSYRQLNQTGLDMLQKRLSVEMSDKWELLLLFHYFSKIRAEIVLAKIISRLLPWALYFPDSLQCLPAVSCGCKFFKSGAGSVCACTDWLRSLHIHEK